ncbi:MFS transporter [Ktedonosporobacter rubrisoli]|nr:MDR family MFS transporter [Ktedonosporobacter rubrisoli]
MDDSKEIQEVSVQQGRRLHGFALVSVIVALMLMLLVEALDQTIVGTAMPRIISSLHGFELYTWVVTAYLLASTVVVPLVGKLSDQFGRKGFVLAGMAIFLLGSALAGTAQNIEQLIIFRALQGIGSGMGIMLTSTLLADIFPPEERARWMTLYGVVYGFSSLVGPSVGGLITDHGPLLGSLIGEATRWRWIFYLNLPLGIVVLAALQLFLPANISERTSKTTGWAAMRSIDFKGALLAAGATICLLLGLTWAGDAALGWSAPLTMATLIAAFVLYILFFICERFAQEPLISLDLFRNQIFSAASALSLLQGMVWLSLGIYVPLFLQGVLGLSATAAGATITPATVISMASGTLAGLLVSIFNRYQLISIIGMLVMSIGVFLLWQMTPATSPLLAGMFMVIASLGLGVLFPIPTLAVQNSLPNTRLGAGTAASKYLGLLGPTLGVAIVGVVVNHSASSNPVKHLPTSPAEQQMLATALQYGFSAILIFSLLAVLASLFLKDVQLPGKLSAKEKERLAVPQETTITSKEANER